MVKESTATGSGLIGVIQTQRDVINDMAISMDGKFLYSVSFDQTLAVFELPDEFGGDKSSNDDLNSNNLTADISINTSNSKQPRKKSNAGVKRKSKNKISASPTSNNNKAITLATQTSNRSMKSLKLGSNASNSSTSSRRSKSKTKSDTIKYSLSELLADESMASIKHCKGVIIANDGKYPFWKLCLSKSGQTVVCASRKVRIFTIKGNPSINKENVSGGPNVSDADLDHVRSLKLRNGNLLLCRTLVPRAKLFDVNSGKEVKKIGCKAPVQAVMFFCFLFLILFIIIVFAKQK